MVMVVSEETMPSFLELRTARPAER
jgi:hypothetical protein